MSRAATHLLILSTCLLLIGCSRSNLGTVNGSVTVDGEPAKVGAVSFFAVDGRAPTAGAPIADGKFSAQVTPGVCMVQIRVSKVVGKKKIYDTPDSPVREVWAEVLRPIQRQYRTPARSKSGTNEPEYTLRTK